MHIIFFIFLCMHSIMCMEEEPLLSEEIPSQGREIKKIPLSSQWQFKLSSITTNNANKKSLVMVDKKQIAWIIAAMINKEAAERQKKYIKLSGKLNHLKSLQTCVENYQGSMAALSPHQIAEDFMPFLNVLPKIRKFKCRLEEWMHYDYPSFEIDTSDKVLILWEKKGIELTGPLAQCINGLYGLELFLKLGMWFDEHGYHEDPTGTNWQISVGNRKLIKLINKGKTDLPTLNILLEMCHHPFVETMNQMLEKHKTLKV